ncbi:MFS-type transporter SLC18B1 [Strongyloides ratti]|uniref:MFS-type transporter SLC18B1 n=1 Tax=Strongyloides ratti TaxID=34506 RepID=A0A090LL96_STRRB|nr:MFS-type transporter SLC18B1 [Strongyloides ratti]CEF70490.1 MFS-type transporter SLC18B1 [Strongyloides ratti]
MENTSLNHKTFSTFGLKEWIVFFTIILSNTVCPMAFACISSFFNDVAFSKNVSLTSSGFIFAIFNFGGFILSPVIGKLIPTFGVKKMFSFGMIFISIGTFLFSLTNLINNGTWFFVATFSLRIFQSMGNAMVFTTTYAIASKDFPSIMTTVLGSVETGAGLGYTVGPLIGGYLYQYVGYFCPFLVLGGVAGMSAIIALFFITSNDNDKNLESITNDKNKMTKEKNLTWFEAIKIKDIWCIVFTIIIVGVLFSFHDSTLAIGCKQFNLDPSKVGLLFLCLGGLYAIFCPILGFIIDKYPIIDILFFIGYFFETTALMCMGPLPFFKYKPSVEIFAICLSIMGLSCSMIFVPSFKKAMDIVVKEHNFSDSLETSSTVSAIFCSSFSFGAFLGPLIGSALVEGLKYQNAISVIALISFISMIIFTVAYLIPRIYKKCAYKQKYITK